MEGDSAFPCRSKSSAALGFGKFGAYADRQQQGSCRGAYDERPFVEGFVFLMMPDLLNIRDKKGWCYLKYSSKLHLRGLVSIYCHAARYSLLSRMILS